MLIMTIGTLGTNRTSMLILIRLLILTYGSKLLVTITKRLDVEIHNSPNSNRKGTIIIP